ncbi:hypothetical protein ACFQU3_10675 [Terrabacter sp. GCM10028922]|uniref:hypothetical protein n=1 Tax=Terrabacter sp. GCM10028922 TaxID=3273428 RepID=UPI0036094936
MQEFWAFLERFATSPGAAGIAAVIAAGIAWNAAKKTRESTERTNASQLEETRRQARLRAEAERMTQAIAWLSTYGDTLATGEVTRIIESLRRLELSQQQHAMLIGVGQMIAARKAAALQNVAARSSGPTAGSGTPT